MPLKCHSTGYCAAPASEAPCGSESQVCERVPRLPCSAFCFHSSLLRNYRCAVFASCVDHQTGWNAGVFDKDVTFEGNTTAWSVVRKLPCYIKHQSKIIEAILRGAISSGTECVITLKLSGRCTLSCSGTSVTHAGCDISR